MGVGGESANTLRLMLDSVALIKLANDYERVEQVRELVEAGAIELIITHVQVDEITGASDPGDLARRELMLQLVRMARVRTAGAIFDVSRFDESTFASDEQAELLRSITNGNLRHSEDALIALTASVEGCILVTDDKRLTKRARDLGVEVWSFDELLDKMDKL